MIRKWMIALSIVLWLVIAAGCSQIEALIRKPEANMANPASAHCEKNGGTLEMRQDASGGTVGVCVFADGSQCEEWSFFRGECRPGDVLEPLAPTLQPAGKAEDGWLSSQAEDGCLVYQDAPSGLSFHYPANARIEGGDDPLHGLTIIGPEVYGDAWPQISIAQSAPFGGDPPPDGAALAQWLVDHHLLADERQDDVTIAGIVAVHTRHARSPQSYAYDRYQFARAGKLFTITIGHTGDQEDWTLYNHFLETIAFHIPS